MEFNIIRLMSDPVGKQLVLFSLESWCFPRRNIRTSGLEIENWQCFSAFCHATFHHSLIRRAVMYPKRAAIAQVYLDRDKFDFI